MNRFRRQRPLRSINDSIRRRMRALCAVLAAAAVALGVRLYFVQVADHERMYELACKKYITVKISFGG